ncbi:MAG: dihydropteroate synthase [Spirochaetes bacterium]|nr:dihydropteroate synthase [Spirochaetota bacterium]
MRSLTFGDKTLIMGVINVTSDSFYRDSRVLNEEKAIERGLFFIESGADIVDIGGMSTRPGSESIDIEKELKRVIPVVKGIRSRSDVFLSVDTYNPEVAEQAVAQGADIINDISGLSFNNGLEEVVSHKGVYIILMHMRGKPADMQKRAVYNDVINEVLEELDISIVKALGAGINKEKIILDPGIGFAKLAEHNLTLLRNLPFLKEKGYPVIVGLSRKSFLGALTGLEPEERLIPTVAANAISIFQGVDIIRVHDVKEAVSTAQISDAIRNAQTRI